MPLLKADLQTSKLNPQTRKHSYAKNCKDLDFLQRVAILSMNWLSSRERRSGPVRASWEKAKLVKKRHSTED